VVESTFVAPVACERSAPRFAKTGMVNHLDNS
jgi:hypothetical protein